MLGIHNKTDTKILQTFEKPQFKLKHARKIHNETDKRSTAKSCTILRNLNVSCSWFRMLLICPCNEDVPKDRPPFKKKTSRGINS